MHMCYVRCCTSGIFLFIRGNTNLCTHPTAVHRYTKGAEQLIVLFRSASVNGECGNRPHWHECTDYNINTGGKSTFLHNYYKVT